MNKIVWSIVGITLLITLGLEFTFLSDYDSHWWNSIPAFYALYGFLCCVAIIYFGKFLAKNIVNRDIHYYD
jgi:hypothetical protein